MYQESMQSLKTLTPGASPEQFTAQFFVDPSWELFRGHFPGYPLVPAVLQIEMAVCACDRFVKTRCRLVRIVRAKFMRPVNPGDTAQLDASVVSRDDLLQVKATFRVLGKTVSTSTFLLARAEVTDSNPPATDWSHSA